MIAYVEEFEPTARIAWYGGLKTSKASKVYPAWIITPTPLGCRLWTEETMHGPLRIELAKEAADSFWCAHEKMLHDLAEVAIEREGGATG